MRLFSLGLHLKLTRMGSRLVSWLFFKARPARNASRSDAGGATSISKSIRKERATRKNSQSAAARRVALKMGRRLRCSSVTYRFRNASFCPSGSDRLYDGPFYTTPFASYIWLVYLDTTTP